MGTKTNVDLTMSKRATDPRTAINTGSAFLDLCIKNATKRSLEQHKVWGDKIEGAESLPRSKFEKEFGKAALDNYDRKLRTHGRREYEGFQSNTFNDPDGVRERVVAQLDELTDSDPSNAALIIQPNFRQLRVGTVPPAGTIRGKYGLSSPMKDEVYMDNLDVILRMFMEGVVRKYGTIEEMTKATIRASLPSDRGKGTGFEIATDGEFADFTSGPDANYAMNSIVFPKMIEHPDGVFMYEGIRAPNATAMRAQNPTVNHLEDGSYLGKWRGVAAFDANHQLREGTHWEPADGNQGMRIRIINNISLVKQMPLIIVDKIFMYNLTPKLKEIIKSTPAEIQHTSIGGASIDTDFSQFEFTQEDEIRTYIAKTLFSDRVAVLLKDLDDQDIIGAYVDDVNDPSGTEAKNIYYVIRKYGNKDVQERFSVLLSGLGITSLYGKVLGMAEIGTICCRSLGMDARTFWGYPNTYPCPGSIMIRNCGDDNRTFAHFVRNGEVKAKGGNYKKWYEKHLDHVNNDKRFMMGIEGEETGGGSYTGIRNYNKNGVSPLDPDHVVEFSHVSHSRMISNIIQKENTIGSAHRPEELEFSSLWGALESAQRSMVDLGGRPEEFWQANAETVLDLIDCPYDLEELEDVASEEAMALADMTGSIDVIKQIIKKPFKELTKEDRHILAMSKATLTQMVMQHYDLKNPDEIVWNLDRDQLRRDFGDAVFSTLFILIPDVLTKDLTRFINCNFFEEVRKDLNV